MGQMRKSTTPRLVQLAAAVVMLCFFSTCFVADNITGEGDAKEIRKTGREAKAEILEIWDTGMSVNDDPIVGFKLRVRDEGAEVYEAKTQGLVSRLHIPQVQPGMVIPVAIDPNDRSRVAIKMYK